MRRQWCQDFRLCGKIAEDTSLGGSGAVRVKPPKYSWRFNSDSDKNPIRDFKKIY